MSGLALRSPVCLHMSLTIREVLGGLIAALPDQNIAVGGSGGMDSSSLVLSALDVSKDVTVVSFTLDDRESSDFQAARRLADKFGLPFLPVFLPTDPDVINSQVRWIVQSFRTSRKTTIECLFPFVSAFPLIADAGLGRLLVGHCADVHFGLSKKAMIHYSHTPALFRQYRREQMARPDQSQQVSLPTMGRAFGVEVSMPYSTSDVFDLWIGLTWEDMNKPRQKEVVRREFPELVPLKVTQHRNFQVGDSGIAETVGEAVRQRITPNAKSAVSAYNRLLAQAEG